MTTHAGFAVALSVTSEAIQALLHAAYVNNVLPAVQRGTVLLDGFAVDFDVVLAEPILTISAGGSVTFAIEVVGKVVFHGAGKPTITNRVAITGNVTAPVIMRMLGNGTVQFGIDGKTPTVTKPTATRLSGPNPFGAYEIDTDEDTIAFVVLTAVMTEKAALFILTPPQLPILRQLGLGLTATIANTPGSLNIGIDVGTVTAGDGTKLFDLNRSAMAKGWNKTLHDVQVDDDEFGAPYYEPVWTTTAKRKSGPHNTELAIAFHPSLIALAFKRVGRHAIVDMFERSKHEGVRARLEALRGKSAKTEYQPNSESLTFINELDVELHDDYLQVKAVASNNKTVEITADVEFKLRVVRTTFDSNLAKTTYHSGSGFTVEVYDVDIEQPGWLTAIEVVVGAAGIALAPFTLGVSAIIAFVLDLFVIAFSETYTANAESGIGIGIVKAASGFDGHIEFALPGTKAPMFRIVPNDIVVNSNALVGWFAVSPRTPAPSLRGMGLPPGDITWPATKLAPIGVRLINDTALYNHADSEVRIRWRVYAEGSSLPILATEQAIAAPGAKHISIDHANLGEVTGFKVRCRVFRDWPSGRETLYHGKLTIEIRDRLDRRHAYLRWRHVVHYQDYSAKLGDPQRAALGWKTVDRTSQIHRTDPATRCRFADQFPAAITPDYFDKLPFPVADVGLHRNVLCEYCFFGGPDKSVMT